MAQNYKAIVSVPGWAEMLEEGGKNNITTTALAYAYVPLIYRAVRIRCDALIRPRVVLTDKSGKDANWPFQVDPKDLLWKSEASLLLTGGNYIEKMLKSMSKKVADLNWVNPTTMDKPKRTVDESGRKDFQFKQNGNPKTWTLADMMYMREFSLTDDIAPGVSAGAVALNDAALLRYMGRSVTIFFETGMMPVTLLQVQGLVDKDEATRIEGFFKRMTTGIKNLGRVLALNREIEPKVISQPLKDMVIPELYAQAKENVAHAFGFNPSLMDSSPNRATALEHRLALYQDTVEPRGDWFVEQFNRQVFTDMGLTMSLDYSDLDIYQEDETQRSNSLTAITNAIATNPEAALFTMTEVLGYDLTEEQIATYNSTFLLGQESVDGEEESQNQGGGLADNATVDAGTIAATTLNGAQISSSIDVLTLLSQGEISDISATELLVAVGIERSLAESMVAAEKAKPKRQTEETVPQQTPAQADLVKWQKKATKLLEKGKSAECDFVSQYIDDDTRDGIKSALVSCKTVEDIRAVFVGAEEKEESDSEIKALLKAVTEEVKLVARQPQNITVTANIPATENNFTYTAPPVSVNIPEQAAPIVNVSAPEVKAELQTPQVIVNVPEQQINIEVKPADVNLPAMPKEATITTDKKGNKTLRVK